jgi:predicted ester cyclase
MSDPLALFTRLIEESFNAGDLEVLSELIAPDFVEHQFESPQHPARAVGPAGVAQVVQQLRAGADNFHLAIQDSSVTGDTVWARLRATGTDTNGQLGRPSTGVSFEITVIDIARYADGLMVEHWGVPDRLGLLLQLGLYGPPAISRPTP